MIEPFTVRIYVRKRYQADGDGKSAVECHDVDVKSRRLFELLNQPFVEICGGRNVPLDQPSQPAGVPGELSEDTIAELVGYSPNHPDVGRALGLANYYLQTYRPGISRKQAAGEISRLLAAICPDKLGDVIQAMTAALIAHAAGNFEQRR